MKISVVSTLYKSAPYIREFVERVRAELKKLTDDYEIILVDDGSPDDSLQSALTLLPTEPPLKVIELSRNFGHHKAIMTGLEHASGDLVFLIDVDLEEPPELLGEFLPTLRDEGLDVVFGLQKARKGRLIERFGGHLAWKFVNLFLPVKIPHSHSTVRLMTRDYVNALVRHKENKTAIGGLWVMTGFKQKGVNFEKGSRGQTSYGMGKRLVALLDSITSFSELPLFIVFFIGCAVIFVSMVTGAFLIIRRLNGHLLEGWASTIVLISFFGGLAVFSIGVVGLYVSRIFIETKGRPYTLIRKIHGRNSGGLRGADVSRAWSVSELPKTEPAIKEHYADFYSQRNPSKVYPVEFVVRTLLGTYPHLKLDRSVFRGARILDLGFGDGRNMPLLHDLGFEIHGVEISDEICRLTRERMGRLGVPVCLATGDNSHIPFNTEAFDFILACHACYYVSLGQSFADNLREIARVLCTGGRFIFSLAKRDSYVLNDAEPLGNGLYRITQDPYGLRNGGVFRAFESMEEILDEFGVYFRDFSLGLCENDFYGIYEKVWIGTCLKKS
jgi:putative glycosyltransferase